MNVTATGNCAILVFAIMHSGIKSVLPASHIDNKYAELFHRAKESGVSIIEYQVPLLNFYEFTQ
jgi:sugar fermentation stimulation protein A